MKLWNEKIKNQNEINWRDSEDRMEKVRFLCFSGMAEVAKLSAPRSSHMWKTHQALQAFKDYHSKTIAVCKAWIKSIRVHVKTTHFF